MAARTILLAAASTALLLPACTSGDAGRYIQSEAFERCRDRTGDSRERCIEQEEERVAEKLARDNEACLEDLDETRERTAIRRGEQAPRPLITDPRAC